MTQNGEVFFREVDGSLWIAQSFITDGGETVTQSYEIGPAEQGQPAP
jgi:hypothetical protein